MNGSPRSPRDENFTVARMRRASVCSARSHAEVTRDKTHESLGQIFPDKKTHGNRVLDKTRDRKQAPVVYTKSAITSLT